MRRKIIWIDTETTGLDAEKCAIVQLAAIIDIEGRTPEAFNVIMKPFDGALVSEEASKVHGIDDGGVEQRKGIEMFKNVLKRYVDKFDKRDKFVVAGYNVGFDVAFLRATFIRLGDKYYGSWFFAPTLDIYTFVAREIAFAGIRLVDYKLSTVCEHYKISIDAHDALSDVIATKQLFEILSTAPTPSVPK